ncbi:MAG: hypothetical protein AAF629_00705 [Chloroflexota bacterium]
MHNRYREQAREAWSKARRKALWGKVRANLQGHSTDILNFDDVSQTFHLRTAFPRGIQEIPVRKIVGSVGRYQDFVDTFLPKNQAMQDRWQSVASLYLDPSGPGAPPIDVYKVGDAYFVSDGNHRVSVVNQLGLPTIEANVKEFKETVYGLTNSRTVDQALAETERHTFFEHTELNEVHPECDIRLTASGGYEAMLGQIVYYQYVLGEIDGTEKTLEEAAIAWYTFLYQTTVQIIDDACVMDLFPDRTSADFYIWITRSHHDLERQYGEQVSMQTVVADIEKQATPSFTRKIYHGLHKWLKQRS